MEALKMDASLRDALSRLESIDSKSVPILSVYLNLTTESREGLSVNGRLRDLLRPVQVLAESGELERSASMSLRADVARALDSAPYFESNVGHGAALFLCEAIGLEERLTMPRRVWDVAMTGPRPYLRPLRAVLDEYRRVATVVLDSRRAEIVVSQIGEILEQQVIEAEEVRKQNLAGWHGLEEKRHRQHAEEVRNGLFRQTAERLALLHRQSGIELIFVGGQRRPAEALLEFLDPAVAAIVGERFVVDIHTLTQPRLMEKVAELEEAYERRQEGSLVDETYRAAAADELSAIGPDWVLRAANRRAISLLLVHNGAVINGAWCPGCGTLARSGGPCTVCESETQVVNDLFEPLARSVVEAGGVVEHILAPTRLADDLVIARLRFSV